METTSATTPQLIQQLLAITAELTRRHGRPFTLDGHAVGSIGEVLAAELYGLNLQRPSTAGHDAIDAQGRRVEVKATTGTREVALRDCHADRLIVLQITEGGEPVEVYDGPAAPVWAAVAHKKAGTNGQKKISLSKLRRLQPPTVYGLPTRRPSVPPNAAR